MRRAALLLATVAAAISAATASAAPNDFAAYRAQVNAICRANTPKLSQAEQALAAAKRAGDVRKQAYEIGVVLGMSYVQGMRIEHVSVPAQARVRMAEPLRILHAVDLQTRRVLQSAAGGDAAGFASQAAKLGRLAAPINAAFDAVGLRDCGSNQG